MPPRRSRMMPSVVASESRTRRTNSSSIRGLNRLQRWMYPTRYRPTSAIRVLLRIASSRRAMGRLVNGRDRHVEPIPASPNGEKAVALSAKRAQGVKRLAVRGENDVAAPQAGSFCGMPFQVAENDILAVPPGPLDSNVRDLESVQLPWGPCGTVEVKLEVVRREHACVGNVQPFEEPVDGVSQGRNSRKSSGWTL